MKRYTGSLDNGSSGAKCPPSTVSSKPPHSRVGMFEARAGFVLRMEDTVKVKGV